MPRAVHRIQYEYFRVLLQEARESSGLTQVQLAELLGKPQSFVSKSERGERRIDFTEFLDFMDAMKGDDKEFIARYRERLSRLKVRAHRSGGAK